jgi:hypothetical protein
VFTVEQSFLVLVIYKGNEMCYFKMAGVKLGDVCGHGVCTTRPVLASGMFIQEMSKRKCGRTPLNNRKLRKQLVRYVKQISSCFASALINNIERWQVLELV